MKSNAWRREEKRNTPGTRVGPGGLDVKPRLSKVYLWSFVKKNELFLLDKSNADILALIDQMLASNIKFSLVLYTHLKQT